MENDRKISDICKEMGQKYAKEMGFGLANLKIGLYHIVEIEDEKVAEIKETIQQKKEEIDKRTETLKSIEDELPKLKEEHDKIIHGLKNEKDKYDVQKKAIERQIENNRKRKARKSPFNYKTVNIFFYGWTIAFVCLYLSFWYNGLFSQSASKSIIDAKFYLVVFQENDYWGLFLSFILTIFPLGLSYLFNYRNKAVIKIQNKQSTKWETCKEFTRNLRPYIPIIIAIIMDVLMAYKIVEHSFLYQKKMGFVPKETMFDIWLCLRNLSFYLILIFSILAYFIWGKLHSLLNDLKQPDEAIDKIINDLEDNKNTIITNLDELDCKIVNQEELYSNSTENKKNQIQQERDNIEKIKSEKQECENSLLKPTTTKLDLTMKASFFYSGFIGAYRNNSPKGTPDEELEEKVKHKETIIDEFVEDIVKSGKFIII